MVLERLRSASFPAKIPTLESVRFSISVFLLSIAHELAIPTVIERLPSALFPGKTLPPELVLFLVFRIFPGYSPQACDFNGRQVAPICLVSGEESPSLVAAILNFFVFILSIARELAIPTVVERLR